MAVDSRGPKGEPIFLNTGAPATGADLTLLGAEAYARGTRLVVTEAERDALTSAGLAYDYLRVFNTTSGAEEMRVDGAWVIGTLANLQLDTTSTRVQMATQYGMGKMTGVVAVNLSSTITFPQPFASVPVVTGGYIGGHTSGAWDLSGLIDVAPSTIGKIFAPTLTNCAIRMNRTDGANMSAGYDYYFSWTATGPLA